ncbi:hypothetical protein CHLRE_14g608950v5 [Chlamydomonas reinhardtii]|uniref:Uncharacterized protein n=1 Tax=Chlamydomonas reinhardtii TaxID=3055 RepID=A0A2K3CX42_CHLRE|nr:uncharacterized protein CHLRE_14g608950v5 [Chlamydomonas reinhardtii]PNW72851.1 hypothetical protein CHLRE_14g608950v5 [Chlamydomonas reinhardtii]
MQEQQQQPPPLTGPPAPNAATAAVAAAAGAGADVGAVRVAVGQMTACGDQAANLEVCSRLVQAWNGLCAGVVRA